VRETECKGASIFCKALMIGDSLLQGIEDGIGLDLTLWDWSGAIGNGENVISDSKTITILDLLDVMFTITVEECPLDFGRGQQAALLTYRVRSPQSNFTLGPPCLTHKVPSLKAPGRLTTIVSICSRERGVLTSAQYPAIEPTRNGNERNRLYGMYWSLTRSARSLQGMWRVLAIRSRISSFLRMGSGLRSYSLD
jgi:hypothetical protein